MNAVLGEEITSGSTNATQLVFTDVTRNEEVTFFVKVTSGSFRLGKGSVHASAYYFPTDDKVPFTCKNGDLYFKANGASDKLVVTR